MRFTAGVPRMLALFSWHSVHVGSAGAMADGGDRQRWLPASRLLGAGDAPCDGAAVAIAGIGLRRRRARCR